MQELFQTVIETMDMGKDLILVTVTESSGSAPRGAGSRMLVLPDGAICGTIGGGNIEYTAIQDAVSGIKKGTSFFKNYKLHPNEAANLGMICGGSVTAYFQYITHTDLDFYKRCQTLLKNWEKDRELWLILDLTEEHSWNFGIYGNASGFCGIELPERKNEFGSEPNFAEFLGHHYYIEPLVKAGTVYIFGGGHVAQELVPVLNHLDFRCIVFDDRAEFANKEIFPDAANCITGDFEHISDYIDVKPEDYVCIMTRGHLFDYYVQKQILNTPASYIGVMGSRRKTLTIRQKLLADGFTEAQIDRCKSPIGLNIYAETPAEIAVSIAGELIAKRKRGCCTS